jgi:hypothetical protein
MAYAVAMHGAYDRASMQVSGVHHWAAREDAGTDP